MCQVVTPSSGVSWSSVGVTMRQQVDLQYQAGLKAGVTGACSVYQVPLSSPWLFHRWLLHFWLTQCTSLYYMYCFIIYSFVMFIWRCCDFSVEIRLLMCFGLLARIYQINKPIGGSLEMTKFCVWSKWVWLDCWWVTIETSAQDQCDKDASRRHFLSKGFETSRRLKTKQKKQHLASHTVCPPADRLWFWPKCVMSYKS